MIGLAMSTFYAKPLRPRALREKCDADLRDKIELIHAKFPWMGYRMLRVYLQRDFGLVVNWKRIRRIMKKFSLHAEVKRAFVVTTDSNHGLPVFPNLISAMAVDGINQVWVADITYIRILTGFVYLAVVLDVYSRKVVGFAVSRRIDAELTTTALAMAIDDRKPRPGLIHHSDRGVQYAASAYRELLEAHQIYGSMSAKGNPYDNAFAERFMRTLKYEEVYLCGYETVLDVQENLPRFINEVYNRERVHSRLGYLTPSEFEKLLKSDKSNSVRRPLHL
jgi:putative transposase